LQKGTDKQIGQVRADVKRILELKEQGLNENQIQRELYIDSLIEQGTLPKPVAGNDAPKQGLDADAIVKSFGLADDDLSILKVRHADNPAQLIAEAHKLAMSKASVPSATPATQLQNTREAPPPPPESKEQEQAALMETWERVKFNPTSTEYKVTKEKLFGGAKK
jgi:hypothetical protein